MQAFLGIDWGGTYIKTGIVSSQGKILKKVLYSSQNLRKKEIFLSELESILRKFSSFDIKGVGVGAPGIINTLKGQIYYLPNVPGWKNYPLQDILRKRLKLPVFVDNDANLFALAEARCGAGKGKSRAIFLTLGTGLGGAIIFDRKILEGKMSALELGHVPIALRGIKCSCGGRGCIETYVGNKYLLSKYRKLKKRKTEIKEVKEIYKRALAGEKEALIIWKEFSQNLGKFLSGMVNIFNPEVIIFGGGVSGAFKLFKPQVFETIKDNAMWPQIKGLKLVKAKVKDAGIVGAAFLAKESLSKETR